MAICVFLNFVVCYDIEVILYIFGGGDLELGCETCELCMLFFW